MGACYPIDYYKFVCLTPGVLNAGDACSSFNDCAAGTVCLDDGESQECRTVCEDSSDCGGEEECSGTGMGFNVCMAPAVIVPGGE
jgi:hypothetical protein